MILIKSVQVYNDFTIRSHQSLTKSAIEFIATFPGGEMNGTVVINKGVTSMENAEQELRSILSCPFRLLS